ncbi:hypothetical protein BWI92_13055 [Flectobacillus sp. BAB-3569]|nr:hypothetical protein BWI92_13055 [Flectobacillus sp. BAB-3569]
MTILQNLNIYIPIFSPSYAFFRPKANFFTLNASNQFDIHHYYQFGQKFVKTSPIFFQIQKVIIFFQDK